MDIKNDFETLKKQALAKLSTEMVNARGVAITALEKAFEECVNQLTTHIQEKTEAKTPPPTQNT